MLSVPGNVPGEKVVRGDVCGRISNIQAALCQSGWMLAVLPFTEKGRDVTFRCTFVGCKKKGKKRKVKVNRLEFRHFCTRS